MAGTDPDLLPLPGVLGDIDRIAGRDAALAIARRVGGTRVYIPPRPSENHWLSQLVGHKAALAIADHLTCGVGGLRVDLPLGPTGHMESTRAKVDRLIGEGKSERDIALATRYSTRGVRKRRAALRERDSRQRSLF